MPSDLPADTKDLEAMENLAKMVNDHPPQRATSLSAITIASNIILKQMRKDILGTLDSERKRLKEDDDADTLLEKLEDPELEFDQRSLQDALKYDDGLYCVGSNGRTPASSLSWILSTLFGDLDQNKSASPSMKFFHNKPFRELAWKARCIWNASHFVQPNYETLFPDIQATGPQPDNYFEGFLWAQCLREHRILPYLTPGHKRLTTFQDGKKRAWFAITGSSDRPDHCLPSRNSNTKLGNCLTDRCAKEPSEDVRYYFPCLERRSSNGSLEVYHRNSYSRSSSTQQVEEALRRVAVDLSSRVEDTASERRISARQSRGSKRSASRMS